MESKHDATSWRHIRHILVVNVAVAVSVTLMVLLIAPGQMWPRAARLLVSNLVYANAIGSLAATLIPPVAMRVWRYAPLKRWSLFVGLLLAIGAVGAFAGSAVLLLLNHFPPRAFWAWYWGSARMAMLLTVIIGVSLYLYEALKYRAAKTTLELREQQLERARAETLAVEARLTSLESRLQPHFLFNTINSILALIREDPRAAETMLERLSRLLRFALDSQHRRLVPLSDELRLVSDYLAIERARFGGRLRFRVDAPLQAAKLAVPPYALQTLVENSMKFAVAPRREGGEIHVSALEENGEMVLEVSDDGPGFTRDAISAGHGLDTLEKRLEALFGARAELIIDNGEGARVRLRLPSGAAE